LSDIQQVVPGPQEAAGRFRAYGARHLDMLAQRAGLSDDDRIFRDAYAGVSGLCRSVRGPSMSATPGKVCVDGIAEVAGQRVFVLRMLQARDPSLVGRPFFARFDPLATWLTDLEPAFADRFPFDPSPFRAGESGTGLPGELPGIWPGELAPAG